MSAYLKGFRRRSGVCKFKRSFLMRNLLTSALASAALATFLVGSASAADMSPYANRNINPAEQAQLQRDAKDHYLKQGLGAGELVTPGGQTAAVPAEMNSSHE